MKNQKEPKPPETGNTKRIQKAATLLLVRDGETERSIEVFMLQRPSRGAFPGLHVFTGGKVDATDATLLATMNWVGPDETEAAALLDSTDAPLTYWLAAVRECYEESGVLLGQQAGGGLSKETLQELASSRLEEFGGLCERLGITLNLDWLMYFAHWVTPEMAPRRFDTRFFVARLPEGQIASFAPGETISGEWVTPAEALARAEDGRWSLITPTLTSLRSLLPYESVDALMSGVKKFEHLPDYSESFRSEGMQSGVNPEERDR